MPSDIATLYIEEGIASGFIDAALANNSENEVPTPEKITALPEDHITMARVWEVANKEPFPFSHTCEGLLSSDDDGRSAGRVVRALFRGVSEAASALCNTRSIANQPKLMAAHMLKVDDQSTHACCDSSHAPDKEWEMSATAQFLVPNKPHTPVRHPDAYACDA